MIKTAARKVTLELIYDAVDERFKQVDDRLQQVKGEMDSMKGEIRELRQTVDRHYSGINERIDQLYHLYAEFLRTQSRRR